MTFKQALYWTLFWIVAAIGFDAIIYINMGPIKAAEFGNAYVIEKLLSFDNLFVFLLIFQYFKIDNQRKLLNFGICGAVVLRAICIFSGVELIANFQWLLYGLGAVLVYSAYGVFFSSDGDNDISESKIVKLCERLRCNRFLMCLIAIEFSDIIFAMDSIPAVLAITTDPFIAYTSNIFAILGLRSIYFMMKNIESSIEKMNYGIGLVLFFIGIKMIASYFIHISSLISLTIVMGILLTNALIILLISSLKRK